MKTRDKMSTFEALLRSIVYQQISGKANWDQGRWTVIMKRPRQQFVRQTAGISYWPRCTRQWQLEPCRACCNWVATRIFCPAACWGSSLSDSCELYARSAALLTT